MLAFMLVFCTTIFQHQSSLCCMLLNARAVELSSLLKDLLACLLVSICSGSGTQCLSQIKQEGKVCSEGDVNV